MRKIIEVTTPAHIREFLMLPVGMYAEDKNYIRPFDKDVEAVFDPKKNKFFRHGECIRWILQEDGKTIGRVAAFINKKTAKKGDQPTGGMGFFECIDDQEAANLLFDQCKSWLEERGMEAMDGPINFGERDKWWGLLVDGFYEPNYCMPYNFPYYQQLFENYGFQLYFNQYTYKRPMGAEQDVDDKMKARAEAIFKDKDYTFRHLTKKEADVAPEYFRTVYNAAWARHGGVAELNRRQAEAIFNQLKPIIDWQLIWFGFYKDEPIAFFIMIPEINQIVKHLNGKLGLWEKIKFKYHQLAKTNKKGLGLVFGVVPKHQGRGAEAGIIRAYTNYAWHDKFQYKDLEMNWIGDFNPRMLRVCEQIGSHVYKTHITYRYLFDRNKPFKRMPIVGGASKN